MSFYDDLREGMAEVEAVFGLPATRTRTTAGAFDPVTRRDTDPVSTTTPIKVAKRKSEKASQDQTISVFTCFGEVRIGDSIGFSGKTYAVTAVDINDQDGSGLTWIATARSGA